MEFLGAACEFPVQPPPFGGQVDAPRPAVVFSTNPAYQALLFQQAEQGRYGVGIGVNAEYQLLLDDAVLLGQKRHDDELVGCHAELGAMRLEAAVHRQVGTP